MFAREGQGYGLGVDNAAIVTSGLMVVFAVAMVVAVLLERRRARRQARDPSRVPADLRRRVRSGATHRHPEEER